jgi:hypothetical protein
VNLLVTKENPTLNCFQCGRTDERTNVRTFSFTREDMSTFISVLVVVSPSGKEIHLLVKNDIQILYTFLHDRESAVT